MYMRQLWMKYELCRLLIDRIEQPAKFRFMVLYAALFFSSNFCYAETLDVTHSFDFPNEGGDGRHITLLSVELFSVVLSRLYMEVQRDCIIGFLEYINKFTCLVPQVISVFSISLHIFLFSVNFQHSIRQNKYVHADKSKRIIVMMRNQNWKLVFRRWASRLSPGKPICFYGQLDQKLTNTHEANLNFFSSSFREPAACNFITWRVLIVFWKLMIFEFCESLFWLISEFDA